MEVETSEDTETSIEYKYLISGASWYPKYSLQLTDESRNGQLSWFALVRNDTGEDWEKIKLFFTASNPDLDIDLPIVREWRIQTQTSVEDSKEYPNDENDSSYAMRGAVQGEVIKKEAETEKSPKKKSRLRLLNRMLMSKTFLHIKILRLRLNNHARYFKIIIPIGKIQLKPKIISISLKTI